MFLKKGVLHEPDRLTRSYRQFSRGHRRKVDAHCVSSDTKGDGTGCEIES